MTEARWLTEIHTRYDLMRVCSQTVKPSGKGKHTLKTGDISRYVQNGRR